MKSGKYLSFLGELFYAAAPNLLLPLDLTTRFKWTLHDSLQAKCSESCFNRATLTVDSIDVFVLDHVEEELL